MEFKPKNTKAADVAVAATAPTERLTNLSTRLNKTNEVRPTSLRLTQKDKVQAEKWLAELQEQTDKPLSIAKMLRGLLYMQNKIKSKDLIDSIKNNT